MADLGAQLELNQAINKVIGERSQLLAQNSSMLSEQIRLAQELCAALACDDGSLSNMSNGLLGAAEAAAQAADGMNQFGGSAGNASKGMQQLGNQTNVAAATAAGAAAAFKGVMSIFGKLWGWTKSLVVGMAKLTWNIAKGIYSITKAIISIPFRVMEGLISMANDLGGNTAIANALEDIRDKFGNLQYGTANLIKDGFRPLKSQFNDVAASGFKFNRIFGAGPQGMANAIAFLGETMGALGGAAVTLRGQIEASLGEITVYQKGLGMTAEQQATMMKTAMATGRPILEMQENLGHYAVHMARLYGDNSKEIGRAMSEMAADTANYGNLSEKTLAQVAVYTRKLGIETKQLQGLIDKYDDFENAAQAASQLNQTFGMQVDILKLMREEDPAARLNQLQRSFQATGRSYEKLSRVEKKRLADLAGMDENTAKLAFSQHGLSMSYEEIQASGDKTEDTMKTVGDTMKELSKNIKRMVPEPGQFNSFFDAFTQGFQRGITHSGPFMKIMNNLRAALQTTNIWGRKVGDMFVNLFPGVKQVFGALADLFDPKQQSRKMEAITNTFEKFFKALKGGPEGVKKAFSEFFDGIQKIFLGDAKNKQGAANSLLGGVKEFAVAAGNIFLAAVGKILSLASNIFPMIITGIKKFRGTDVSGTISGVASDAASAFMDNFGPGLEGLGQVITEELWPAIENFAFELAFQIADSWETFKAKYWPAIEQWWLTEAWPAISKFFICTVGPALNKAWDVFIADYWPGIRDWFIKVFNDVWKEIVAWWNSDTEIVCALKKIIDEFIDYALIGFLFLVNPWAGIAALILKEFLPPLWEGIKIAIQNIWELFTLFIDNFDWKWLIPGVAFYDLIFGNLGEKLVNYMKDAWDRFAKWGGKWFGKLFGGAAETATKEAESKGKSPATLAAAKNNEVQKTQDQKKNEENLKAKSNEMDSMSDTIKKVSKFNDLKKQYEDALKNLPTDEMIEEIKGKIKVFVEAFNKVIETVDAELSNLKINNLESIIKNSNKMSDVIKAVSGIADISKGVKNIETNNVDPKAVESSINNITEAMRLISQNFDLFHQYSDVLIDKILGSSKLSDPKYKVDQMKEATNLVEAAGKLSNFVNETGQKIDIGMINHSIANVKEAIDLIQSGSAELMTKMNNIGNYENSSKNIKSLSEIFTTVSGLQDVGNKKKAVNNISKFMEELASKQDAIHEKATNLKSYDEATHKKVESFVRFVNKMNEFPEFKNKVGAVQNFVAFMAEIDKSNQAIENNINNLSGYDDKIQQKAKSFISITEIFNGMVDVGNKSKSIDNLNSMITKLGSGQSKNIENAKLIGDYTESEKNLNTFVEFVKSFDNLMKVIPDLSKKKVEGTVSAFNTALKDVTSNPDIHVVAEIARGLQGEGKIVFEHKNTQFNINVNVKMDARQITAAVLSTDFGEEGKHVSHNFTDATINKLGTFY